MLAHIVVKTVILNHNLHKNLLIRRRIEDMEGWEGAGGKVEEGESLEEAVCREVLEETGLTVVPERFLYASLDEICGKNIIFVVYLCSTTEENVVLSSEHTEYRWTDREECRALLRDGIARDYEKYGVYELIW